MRIGTKSVLFGAHQFILHPILLAIGWWKAYGLSRVCIGRVTERRALGERDARFPTATVTITRGVMTSLLDPRLWIAFVVHDLGYLGKPNMDGEEGESHPVLGARIMWHVGGQVWHDFVLLHSRYYAKKLNRPVSPLCMADKWVIVLEPWWLYLPRVWMSGELTEFIAVARARGEAEVAATDALTPDERAAYRSGSARRWHSALQTYMRRWIAAHQDGQPDTWTPVRHGSAA